MDQFRFGLVSYPEPQSIPRGAASSSLNFITRGTKIETRNGYAVFGSEIAGNGKSYLYTAHLWDGTELVFKAAGNSLYYYSTSLADFVEVGSNILAGNNGERIWFAEYTSPAGAQLWISSTHTDLIKIMTANPGSYTSMFDTSKNFKGSIAIKSNRMFLWNYLAGTLSQATKNTLQGSYIDAMNFTTVSGESVGTGDGSTKTFTGTLAFKGGNPKGTCFALTFTDTNENFTDDYLGNLVGSLGGTGSINYTTGAYSITFNTAPVNLQAITTSYQWENSTNNGIADFTHSGTRTAGQGVAFVQNDGGAIRNIFTLNGSEYVLHERKAWLLNIPTDDTTATQAVYRDRLALASDRGAVATADGIYYVDTTNKSRPYIAILTYDPLSALVLPKDLSSEILDLSGYVFDQCVAYEWGSFILFACRTTDSSVNNRVVLYNKEIATSKEPVFDLVDYFVNDFATVSGTLISGDSASNSVFTLFSNWDDDGSIPNYYWIGNIDNLGILTLKKVKRLWIEGEIDINQSVDVSISTDRGGFTKVGTIYGSGAYVDVGQNVLIGSTIVGLYPVGGGTNGATAFHYQIEIRLGLDKFQDRQIKFAPTKIGYFSVSRMTDFDIRYHQDKLPSKYRSAL